MSKFAADVLGTVFDCQEIKEAVPAKASKMEAKMEEIADYRGKALYYPMIPSGKGFGPYIELMDGSVKMDLITGIGVSIFGYNHPEIMAVAAKAAFKVPSMQGTLMVGEEMRRLQELLLKYTPSMSGVWMTTCGTMANELALKCIRQKHAPAFKMITFKNSFSGRSSTMSEMTDEPNYRVGQPTFDQFRFISFYDKSLSLEANLKRSHDEIEAIFNKEPSSIAGAGFEPVQGEGGGFAHAPAEWWHALLGELKKRGVGVWFDEVQTFGRTGELFAFQRLGLEKYIDVVSLAKPLHAGAVMWSEDYAPKPGLMGGTFAGHTVALATGAKIVELLCEGEYFSQTGRIRDFENFVIRDWEERRKRLNSNGVTAGDVTVFGGMIAFEVLDGTAPKIKDLLMRLFDQGVIGFAAGKSPVKLRFLPPVGVIEKAHWIQAMDIVESVLVEMSENQEEA